MEHYIRQIDEVGYCKIPQVYDQKQVQKALSLVKTWREKTHDSLSKNLPRLAKNDPFVWNLQNKEYYFLEILFGQSIIQDILMHFLNDPSFKHIPADHPNYILRNYMARSSNKQLPMHIDSLVPYESDHVFVMQVSIILEEHTEANGCTLVIPKSHKSGKIAPQSAFEIAVPIESQPGDVVIWDSRIWHGTNENRTGGTRWAMIATFVRWWIKQGFDFIHSMPQEIYEKLTDNQKAIMGFCSMPHLDETQGIDMKRGYESLPADVLALRTAPQPARFS